MHAHVRTYMFLQTRQHAWPERLTRQSLLDQFLPFFVNKVFLLKRKQQANKRSASWPRKWEIFWWRNNPPYCTQIQYQEVKIPESTDLLGRELRIPDIQTINHTARTDNHRPQNPDSPKISTAPTAQTYKTSTPTAQIAQTDGSSAPQPGMTIIGLKVKTVPTAQQPKQTDHQTYCPDSQTISLNSPDRQAISSTDQTDEHQPQGPERQTVRANDQGRQTDHQLHCSNSLIVSPNDQSRQTDHQLHSSNSLTVNPDDKGRQTISSIAQTALPSANAQTARLRASRITQHSARLSATDKTAKLLASRITVLCICLSVRHFAVSSDTLAYTQIGDRFLLQNQDQDTLEMYMVFQTYCPLCSECNVVIMLFHDCDSYTKSLTMVHVGPLSVFLTTSVDPARQCLKVMNIVILFSCRPSPNLKTHERLLRKWMVKFENGEIWDLKHSQWLLF